MDSVSKVEIQQWLQEFAEGDERAFKKLFHQFYNRLLRYGSTITQHQPIVEDQIQEVFIWLYNHPRKCRSIHNLEAYLYSALKKNLLSSLRKEANQQDQHCHFINNQDRSTRCVEEAWIQSDFQEAQRHWLTHQLDQLSPRMREVIYLRYFQCLSYDEIAGIMSVSPQIAQNFAFRALKKMRQSRPQLQRLLLIVFSCLIAS